MPDFGARWQIVSTKPIGKGGQSHAYLVRDAQGKVEDRYVAKVLNGIDDPTRRHRLDREIASCREFDHPNVVRLIDAGHTGKSNYPFLVLPYYEYGSLEDFRALLGACLRISAAETEDQQRRVPLIEMTEDREADPLLV